LRGFATLEGHLRSAKASVSSSVVELCIVYLI
jgi:hypothetical protein